MLALYFSTEVGRVKDLVKNSLLRFRLPIILTINLLLTAAAYVFALGLRFDFDHTEITSGYRIWPTVAFLLLYRSGAYIFWRLNNGYWRYASTHDLLNIFKAHLFSTLLFAATIGLLRIPDYPRAVIFIEFVLSFLVAGGMRMLVRIWCERYLTREPENLMPSEREVIVLGAGVSGHLIVKNLLSFRDLPYKPVAVLDDSERLVGSNVYGIEVKGTLADLERCLELNPRVAAVITAIPSLSKSRISEIEAICRQVGVAFKRLQAFEDIACLDASEPQEALTIESVLEKEVNIEHEEEIRHELTGKRVLITGGGGSIGSELVRQLLHFQPQEVLVLDSSEYNLYAIDLELRDQAPNVKKHFVLANIISAERINQVFANFRPQFVFHAAAFKHVPLMECNCHEAFSNNILGTQNVLEASAKFGVERFVLISTDKAVDPSSVMGASKRVAELLVQTYAKNNGNSLDTAVVRFGNVINSAGSVIPLFKKQLLSGGPLTVTHPEMERYFMSIREAVRLVLTAGTLGRRGEVFVLDMGKPIRIIDVARKMRALYGRRDIPIVFTGLRPGEKLTEELTSKDEEQVPTRFNKVRGVRVINGFSADVRTWVVQVSELLRSIDNQNLGVTIRRFVTHQDFPDQIFDLRLNAENARQASQG